MIITDSVILPESLPVADCQTFQPVFAHSKHIDEVEASPVLPCPEIRSPLSLMKLSLAPPALVLIDDCGLAQPIGKPPGLTSVSSLNTPASNEGIDPFDVSILEIRSVVSLLLRGWSLSNSLRETLGVLAKTLAVGL